jgi:hypothetical protein
MTLAAFALACFRRTGRHAPPAQACARSAWFMRPLPVAEPAFLCVLSQPQLFFGWRRADCAAKSMGWDQQDRHPVLHPIAP